MRIRTLAAAALAAAGLSVTLTGAAGAATPQDPPPADVHVVTCEDGRAGVRPITEEERAKFEEMRKRAIEKGMIAKRTVDERVAEKGSRPVVVFTTPPGGKGERAGRVVLDDRIPAEKLTAVCAARARPAAPEAP